MSLALPFRFGVSAMPESHLGHDGRLEALNDATAEQVDRCDNVIEWANLYGDDLAGALRLDEHDDAETLSVIEDALWCAWHLRNRPVPTP